MSNYGLITQVLIQDIVYCIEYDLDKLVDKGQNFDFQYKFEIDYKDNIPTLGINDIVSRNGDIVKKMFATKKSAWKHEQEIRLIFDKYGMKKFHASAITGIYFGIKTPETIKESFYGIFKNMDVKFYEVFPSNFKLDFKLINETKRKLKYNLSKFDFEIIRSRTNQWEQVFEIFYKGDYKNENEVREFILAFREKYCIKTNTLTIFNNKEIIDLADSGSLSDDEYVRYANSIITVIYGDDIGIFNPFKDLKYEQILNK